MQAERKEGGAWWILLVGIGFQVIGFRPGRFSAILWSQTQEKTRYPVWLKADR
jgi:hypothetical protein